MKPSVSYRIGQAILSCTTVQDSSCEAQVDWVQPNKGFEPLIGRCPELNNDFSHSDISFSGDGVSHPIIFKNSGKRWNMSAGKSYAALVGWDPETPKTALRVVCIGSKADFDHALEELKRQFHRSPSEAFKPKPKKLDLSPAKVTEDHTRYRVSYFSSSSKNEITFVGTPTQIVRKFTDIWKQDPRNNLSGDNAVWEKKDDEDRYRPTICPELPPPPAMFLTSLRKTSASA